MTGPVGTEPADAADLHGALDLQGAAVALGVHYMTVYRYVRTGRLPARQRRGRWWVDPADLHLVDPGTARTGGRSPDRGSPQRLADRLVSGDAGGARRILDSALAAGRSPSAVLLGLLVPAMRAIGDGWERGDLSVGQEHRATAVATRVLAAMQPAFSRPGRRRGSVLLACVAGEQHALPQAVVATLVRGAGYEVVDLGADTPVSAVVELASSTPRLVTVGLSTSTRRTAPAARRTVRGLREAGCPVPVLVGGVAVTERQHAVDLGADDWAADAEGVVEWLSARGVPARG